ncbi:MAG: cytochrome-c peroxidase, partial [Thermoguttaceae bacterium]
ELGRFIVTRNKSDIGAFRTPSLTNVGITGPYMHDGSLETLWDVVDHYNKGGVKNEYLDGGIEPLNLSEEQVAQLVEFLFALTDVQFANDNTREFVRQTNLANKTGRTHRDAAVTSRQIMQFEPKENAGIKTLQSGLPQPNFENEEHFEVEFVFPQKD